tara:strand:- start:563 stop:967 length:405 start_codon:yes stop_codon:yes gene_type:complete
MSYSHIILTVEPSYNVKANNFADVIRERGQTCDVDERAIGIHKKLERAEEMGYDFIHVMNYLEHEINYINVRFNKFNKYIGEKHIIDFLHELACGLYETKEYKKIKKSKNERNRKNPNDKKHDIGEEKPEINNE